MRPGEPIVVFGMLIDGALVTKSQSPSSKGKGSPEYRAASLYGLAGRATVRYFQQAPAWGVYEWASQGIM